MSANEPTTRVVTQDGADIGPGERLREAREAARLTVGEVASRLRLEPRVVQCLENDDYDALHGPTFVRGYLSSYARLLELPDRPILEAYERHGFGPPALVSELGRKPEVHVSDFPVRMVTYVIAGLLVVLVVLWWQSRQLQEVATPENAGAPAVPVVPAAPQADDVAIPGAAPESSTPAHAGVAASETPPSTSPIASGESEPPAPEHPGSPASEQPAATPPTAQSATTVADAGEARGESQQSEAATSPPVSATAQLAMPPAAEEAGDTGTPVAAVDTALPGEGDETASDAATVAGDIALAEGDAASETRPDSPPRPDPLPGTDVLAIQLGRESWVEIYDRGGGRLYYSLAHQGSEIVVTGAGPMRVLLGEVEGAEVAYNGEPYDLRRFQGRSVVRFTVGEGADAATPEPAAPRTAEEPLTREAEPTTAPEQGPAVADAGTSVTSPVAETPVSTTLAAPEPVTAAPADPDVPEPVPVITRPDS